MHAKQHYFAFLSYSHADQAMAEWLHEAIESFRVPKRLVGRLTENGVVPRRLTPIFRDRGELAAADDLTEEIEEALAGSRFMVVLCSPAAVASKWANAEIAAFKRLHPAGEIFAAIVAGEPFASDMPGREAEECFPPALLESYDSRGRPTGKRAEPIAADLRGDAEARRLGLIQIIAGMLGVGLDELVQREGKRRQQRVRMIVGALLAGMIFTSGMSLWAFQSRDAARDQRREAESLVAFMLGDLKQQLEPIGRLDALGGVGSRVLDYYSKQDTAELSDAGLVQRSQALGLTAQVAFERGKLDQAEQLYREALEGTAEALRRNPGDPQRLFDHAQNVFWVGEMARKRGGVDQMEAAAREYQRLADRMVAIQPDNLRWRMEVSYSKENLGRAAYLQRRFDEAARLFSEAAGASAALAAIEPGNADYARTVTNQLAWLADAQSARGRIDEAIDARRRQIAALERMQRAGGRDVRVDEYLVPGRQGLGNLLAWLGDSDAAIEQLRLAAAEGDRLIQVEPESATWQGSAAAARLDLARVLLDSGRREEAARETAAGCGMTASYLKRAADLAKGTTLRTDCLALRARLALAAGAREEALTLAQRALASARTERSGEWIADPRYKVAAAYRLLGDVHQRAGNRRAAIAAWNAGLAQLPNNIAERPREMLERAEILKRLGRAAEARPIEAKLAAMGYVRSI